MRTAGSERHSLRPRRGRAPAILLCAAISLLPPIGASAEESGRSGLVFLGNKNIAPVVYLRDGVPSGVAVDIVRAIAKRIPRPIEIRAMDWAEAQALVSRGEADALIQINQTEERKRIFDFSDPLLESYFSIFVREGRVGIAGIESLAGLRVGVEAGGLPRQLLEKDARAKITLIPDFLEGFRGLGSGAIDAVVVDYRVGSFILAENDIRGIAAIGDPIASSYSSIAVRKGNDKLLGQIDEALRAIKADGTYRRIIEAWKPKEAVFQTREQIAQAAYRVALPILGASFLIAVAWLLALRNSLAKRKIAERELKDQYSTTASIIESESALIFSLDRSYRYTCFNKGHAGVMKAIYGADIEIGRSLLDYMTVPADRDMAKRNLDRALGGERLVEEESSGEELRSRRYFRVSHSPIENEKGEIIGVAVLAQDITERKMVEDELRRMNDELEGRVRRRTAELEATNRELEKMNKLFVGRELRMRELKEKIARLEGRPIHKEGAE